MSKQDIKKNTSDIDRPKVFIPGACVRENLFLIKFWRHRISSGRLCLFAILSLIHSVFSFFIRTFVPKATELDMKPKDNDWKSRLGVVYSTDPDYQFRSETDSEPVETLSRECQKLRVRIERSGRGGKVVTLVTGFVGTDDDLKALGKLLKTRCGVGGTAKDGEVIVQGERKEQVVALLRSEGYTQTK